MVPFAWKKAAVQTSIFFFVSQGGGGDSRQKKKANKQGSKALSLKGRGGEGTTETVSVRVVTAVARKKKKSLLNNRKKKKPIKLFLVWHKGKRDLLTVLFEQFFAFLPPSEVLWSDNLTVEKESTRSNNKNNNKKKKKKRSQLNMSTSAFCIHWKIKSKTKKASTTRSESSSILGIVLAFLFTSFFSLQ